MLEVETETVPEDLTDEIGKICPKCGCDKPKVFVHGHYQCADCKCVTHGECCQGETA